MRHVHRYRFPEVTMLTLPDVHGWRDCFLAWRCIECQAPGPYTTCQVHEQTRNMTYDALHALWTAEAQRGEKVR